MERSEVTNIMSGRFADAMVTTGGACMVVVAMVALDERVRMHLASVLNGDPSSELVRAGVRAQRVVRIVMDTADAYGNEPVAFALLAVACVVVGTLLLRA